MRTLILKEFAIEAGGGTFNIEEGDLFDAAYVSSGTITLTSNVTIQLHPDFEAALEGADTGKGLLVPIIYDGSGITVDGNTVTIFGVALSEVQAQSKWKGEAFNDGSTWNLFIDLNATQTMLETASIVNDAVTQAKIASGAVGTTELADNSVATSKIIADAVTQDKIAAGAVGTTELADNAVSTAKIVNLAVTEGKLNASSVTTAKIAADAVTSEQLADGSVGTSQLANSSVTVNELVNGAVTTPKIASSAITNALVSDGTLLLADMQSVVALNSYATLLSAEADEIGTVTYEFTERCKVDALRLEVRKTIGASALQVVPRNHTNTQLQDGITGISMSIPATSAVGVAVTATPDTNNIFEAGQRIQFVVTGSGGRAEVFMKITKLDA